MPRLDPQVDSAVLDPHRWWDALENDDERRRFLAAIRKAGLEQRFRAADPLAKAILAARWRGRTSAARARQVAQIVVPALLGILSGGVGATAAAAITEPGKAAALRWAITELVGLERGFALHKTRESLRKTAELAKSEWAAGWAHFLDEIGETPEPRVRESGRALGRSLGEIARATAPGSPPPRRRPAPPSAAPPPHPRGGGSL